jgi:hypothetical protein
VTKFTAHAVAAKNGHKFLDSVTVLESEADPFDARSVGFDIKVNRLRVCGTETEAYFEWVNDLDERMGQIFEVLDRSMLDHVTHWSLKN